MINFITYGTIFLQHLFQLILEIHLLTCHGL